MLRHTLKRLKRSPVSAIGILLFFAVLAIVLCGLHAANEKELRNYEEVYDTIPVELTVTNLLGTNADNLNAPMWVANVFTDNNYNLSGYAADVQIKSSYMIETVDGKEATAQLVGITSTKLAPALLQMDGGVVKWTEGYDDSVFSGQDSVCVIPENMKNDADSLALTFLHIIPPQSLNDEPIRKEYECTLKIVGSYESSNNSVIYCPYNQIIDVYKNLGCEMKIDAIGATLCDNDLLDDLLSDRADWFAEPNPTGEKTPWNEMGYTYYPYALDINDALLQRTIATLQNSLLVNQICTVLVFTLSAAAGFLIGFLMVRSRKKEIALMRTMGTPNRSIYLGFALEQMLCVVLGIVLGGSYNGWNPADRLGILAVIYFVGLTVALQIFLHKNLLTTIKEDE